MLRLISASIIQQASDCDKILVHDNDLLSVDGIGHETVSELLNSNSSRIVLLMLAATGNPRKGRDGGSPPEV